MFSPMEFAQLVQSKWALLSPEARMQAQPYVASTCGLLTVDGAAAGGAAAAALAQAGGQQHQHQHQDSADPNAWLVYVAQRNKHKCGGNCKGSCDDCKCVGGMCGWSPGGIPNNTPGSVPMMVPPGEFPQCYDCDDIDPCLWPMLVEARKKFDDYAWMGLWATEGEIVHLNKDVGEVGTYQDETPLGAGEKMLYSQEDAQQLPYVPGVFKFSGKFSGTPQPGKVKFTFYSGPKGLTDLGDPKDAGLIQISKPYTLEDFTCDGECFLLPWPRVNGCRMRGFPTERAVYVLVEVGDIADNQLIDLSMAIIKRGTSGWKRCCKKHDFEI